MLQQSGCPGLPTAYAGMSQGSMQMCAEQYLQLCQPHAPWLNWTAEQHTMPNLIAAMFKGCSVQKELEGHSAPQLTLQTYLIN